MNLKTRSTIKKTNLIKKHIRILSELSKEIRYFNSNISLVKETYSLTKIHGLYIRYIIIRHKLKEISHKNTDLIDSTYKIIKDCMNSILKIINNLNAC